MCGIIGIIGSLPVTPLLVGALSRLEYRGYDSAGVATLTNGHIERRRAEGKLVHLEALLAEKPLPGTIGIGHTRWATHGKPSERNAHPIATDRVAVVHNGIIENFQELKDELVGNGYTFSSDTDTEVVAQLITCLLEKQLSPEDAVQQALTRLRGAFALVVLFAGRHDILIGARRGSPLAVGYGDTAMYIGTDAIALASFTKRVSYLEEDDSVVLTQDTARFFNDATEVVREVKESGIDATAVGKGTHAHFMLKEIHEQPAVIGETLMGYLDPATRTLELPEMPFDWKAIPRVTFTACGTAFYACLLAEYWFEKLAGIPAKAVVASELRYNEPPLPTGGVMIAVSQSGETADTLAALSYAKKSGQVLLSVVNVPESAIARFTDAVIFTKAGPEISVGSTKAFTTQLTALVSAAIVAGRARGHLSQTEADSLTLALIEVPAQIADILASAETFRALGMEETLMKATSALYLGRGSQYPVALEGALKLKEISYIHAEGYPGGEIKHGPIALIDEHVPTIVLAPSGSVFDKIASNFEQVLARKGKVILLSDEAGIATLKKTVEAKADAELAVWYLTMPTTHQDVAPILYTVAVQLIAYYAALALGREIDQPRNLAKSVTVE